MNSIGVVYENEVSILSQRVYKFSENFKDKWDMLHECSYNVSGKVLI